MKKTLALILTFIMVFALVPSVAFAEGEEGKVTITKTLVSDTPDADGNYTIKLTVQGNPVTQNVQPNADVVLVIDCSGSMNNRMDTAKNAGKRFADGILTDSSDNKMAVIGFSSEKTEYIGIWPFGHYVTYPAIRYETGLTDQPNTIKTKINEMRADGGTDYTAALTKAKQILDGRQDKNRPGYVVFISDGAPGKQGESQNDPNWNGSNQVAQLKRDGVTIYTIGIALDGNQNQAAREYLKSMATSPSHFRNITDANLNTQLETILIEWAAQINEVHAGTNAVMVDVINDGFFDFVSADDGLTYDGDAKSLTWDIGDILKAEQSITFKIKPKDGWTGTKDTNKSCKLNYTKHDGTPGEVEAPSPQVTIAAVVGSLTVTKTVVMPEGDTTSVKDREYTFTIQSGGHTDSKKVVIGDNNTGSVTFDNVPVGEYTVTEAGADIDGYNVVTTSNPADGKVKVAEGQAATIAFTNTYTKIEGPKGELTISKVVNGLPTEILPASFVFEIRKVGNVEEVVESVTVEREENGNTYKPKTVKLPHGEYSVAEKEVDIQGYSLRITSDIPARIVTVSDTPATITFYNTYEQLPPNTGAIIVKKTVSGNASSTLDEFKFKVTVLIPIDPNPDPSGPPIARSANAVKAPAARGVDKTATQDDFVEENGIWTLRFTLKHGDSMKIEELPAGYTYRIEETDALGYTVTVNGVATTSKDVKLKAGETVTLNFNNHKDNGGGGHGHYHSTTTPVPVMVIPPKTGDMTLLQYIARLLGLVR